MRLLSVDWDFFMPEGIGRGDKDAWTLYDWGHNEAWADGLTDVIWPIRAMQFDMAGVARPQCVGWEDFWKRFSFTSGCHLYVADSHSAAFDPKVRLNVDEVWNYDAHHDAGYETTMEEVWAKGQIGCDNWMVGYALTGVRPIDLHVRYPQWKTLAMELEPKPAITLDVQFDDEAETPMAPFSRVFVARSGSWVPPWCDADFEKFLAASPFSVKRMRIVRDVRVRPFSEDDVKAHAEGWAEVKKRGMVK